MNSAYSRQAVLIDAIWPRQSVTREIMLVLAGSLLIAVSSQLQFLLPFSPVPVTGQTFAVLLIAALYGSRRGPITVLTYIMLGAMGVPVFAGGAAGLARLIGPTAGYLAGFVVAAFVVGWLSERGWDRSPWTTALSMVIGNGVIYACGVAWLAQFVGWDAVWMAGFLPFLLGDVVKIAAATILLPLGWKLVAKAPR